MSQRTTGSTPAEPRAAWRSLGEISLESGAQAGARVAEAVRGLCLPPGRLAQLEAAVVETVTQAGVHSQAGLVIRMTVLVAAASAAATTPGQACPARGWGFFFVEAGQAEAERRLELFLYREGAS